MSTDMQTGSPPSTDGEALDPRRWLALGVVLVAAFMDLLDAGIVFLALPSIGQDLHAGYAALQWVAAGDTLAFALVLITAGRLGDIVGRRRLSWSGWPASPAPRRPARPPRAPSCWWRPACSRAPWRPR